MRYLVNTSHDAAYNLAFEEYALRELAWEDELGMLWVNGPSIIIGQYQTTIEQINEPFVKARGIQVVRRITGGGAVYHDLGNINFSFFCRDDAAQLDFARHTRPIVEALHALGLPVELGGRNDLLLDGKKVSGNAQVHWKGRVLHHGTLMFSLNLSDMVEALRVSAEKIESKGIDSVRSRVANLSEHLGTAMSAEAFLAHLHGHLFGGCAPVALSQADLDAIDRLADAKYRSWDWNYGRSPRFALQRSGRFSRGGVRFSLDVRDGRVHACRIDGDFFGVIDIQVLEDKLVGVDFREGTMREALERADMPQLLGGISIDEVISVLFP